MATINPTVSGGIVPVYERPPTLVFFGNLATAIGSTWTTLLDITDTAGVVELLQKYGTAYGNYRITVDGNNIFPSGSLAIPNANFMHSVTPNQRAFSEVAALDHGKFSPIVFESSFKLEIYLNSAVSTGFITQYRTF